MAKAAASELWAFSLAVYDGPGAAPACLALQDRHDADVNLLLFCLWAGVRGKALSQAELRQLAAVAAAWQEEVVKPLRAARRRLKGEADDAAQDLRAKVIELEIEAERQEQVRLAGALTLAAAAPEPRAAAANLLGYLALLQVEPDAADLADLATLLTNAFPDLPPLLAVWFLLP